MRTSILLIRKHGSEAFELLAGPDVPINEQENEFRESLASGGVHPEIAELQRWESDSGLQRTIKFEKPDQAKARKEKIQKDFDDHTEPQKPKKLVEDAPKAAAPKAKVPPKSDAAKTKAPKVEAPAPATEEPSHTPEQPATDAPKVDL